MEALLVILLAAQAAKLTWSLVTPVGPIGDPVAVGAAPVLTPLPDLSVLERFPSPTAPAAAPVPVASPTAASTISGFRLMGVRGSIAGDGGAAIITGPDGQQASYQRGDKVAPGVTLAAVGRDAVTLSSAGSSVRLELGAEAPSAPNIASAPPGLGFTLAPPGATAAPLPAIGAPAAPAVPAVPNVSATMRP